MPDLGSSIQSVWSNVLSISFMHMSNACLSSVMFQIPASNTVGGVAETRTLLQSVTDGRTDVCIHKGKTICPSPLRGGGHKNTA